MWAYVEGGNVHTVYKEAKTFILNGVRYPSNIFKLWTDSEKEAIGIYSVTKATKKDDAYYIIGNPSYSFNSGTKKVIESYSPNARTLSTVKTEQTTYTKNQAYYRIKGYGWLVERKIYTDTAIPSAVTTYIAAVRSSCATICTNIANASDVDAVKSAVDNATWASDTNAVAYRRP
jgi:hypothetical protein